MKEFKVCHNEQIKVKMYEVLTSENVSESIDKNMGYLLYSIPEIERMIGFEHKHPHHHLDVWNHTLLALCLSEKDLVSNKFKTQLCDALAHNPLKLEKRINYLIDMNDKVNDINNQEKYKKLLLNYRG